MDEASGPSPFPGSRLSEEAARWLAEGVTRSVLDYAIFGMKADLVGRVFELFAQGERALDRTEGGLGAHASGNDHCLASSRSRGRGRRAAPTPVAPATTSATRSAASVLLRPRQQLIGSFTESRCEHETSSAPASSPAFPSSPTTRYHGRLVEQRPRCL